MKYEGECIKTMEQVELYLYFINPKQKDVLTLLFLTMFG